jgi:hypothetical protein
MDIDRSAFPLRALESEKVEESIAIWIEAFPIDRVLLNRNSIPFFTNFVPKFRYT